MPLSGSAPLDLTPEARVWLDTALAQVAADPTTVRALFPAVRRNCGRAPLPDGRTVDEAARALLLAALPLHGQALVDEVTALHRYGDPAEQRAVLRALPQLDPERTGRFLDLVRQTLRGNDTTLIEAALGPYAADHLPSDEYRQAVLKCVFCEIPLARVAGLDDRADAELARMLTDFAHERTAAGRPVPEDIAPLVRPFTTPDPTTLDPTATHRTPTTFTAFDTTDETV
ncbi:EboA domain-containing protein [Streptomyces sp. WI04-05B]|uniref:EboA domain-containing protein n=1 Tax=Streptomyces TaxID=1883 RepID=UPI0029ACA92A|nr:MULTISPECIES: EboA domain-containing protein [unclassified Streptomyces]MDX2540363.1 EboA domain-containing protein [Streptomyces sp. WI04-05B]MDX2585204.1 EboA domain-containing protein [Streptomyces sp. WI04-05A]MDX3752337.1 EboA domain-containing protein [Streptomyces sp. AK08-02]